MLYSHVKEHRSKKRAMILLQRSDLFSHGTLVSIYRLCDEDFEELIGFGMVSNVQLDGKIQVEFKLISSDDQNLMSDFAENNGSTLRRIIVKPTVSNQLFSFFEGE